MLFSVPAIKYVIITSDSLASFVGLWFVSDSFFFGITHVGGQLVDDEREGQQSATSRAASLIAATIRFRRALLNETLEPDIFHVGTTAKNDTFRNFMRLVPRSMSYYVAYAANSYPLDMSQYARVLLRNPSRYSSSRYYLVRF
jgi:hypothetical protein